MIFEKVRPATPKYRQLTAEWDKQAHDFEVGDFKDADTAWELVQINRDLESYERRFLARVYGSKVPIFGGDVDRHAGCVREFSDHAKDIRELMLTEIARPGLDGDEREQLRQSTEVLALPYNLATRREERVGMLDEARNLLPLPFVPA